MPKVNVNQEELHFSFFSYDPELTNWILRESTTLNQNLVIDTKLDEIKVSDISKQFTESRIAEVSLDLDSAESSFIQDLRRKAIEYRLQNRFEYDTETEVDLDNSRIIKFLKYQYYEEIQVGNKTKKIAFPAWYNSDFEVVKIPAIEYGEDPYLAYDKQYTKKPSSFSNIYFVAHKSENPDNNPYYFGILDISSIEEDPYIENAISMRFYDANGYLMDILKDIEDLTNFKQVQNTNSGIEVTDFYSKIIPNVLKFYPYSTRFQFHDFQNVQYQEMDIFTFIDFTGNINDNTNLDNMLSKGSFSFSDGFKQRLKNSINRYSEINYGLYEVNFLQYISDMYELKSGVPDKYKTTNTVGSYFRTDIFMMKSKINGVTLIDLVFSSPITIEIREVGAVRFFDTSVISASKRFFLQYNSSLSKNELIPVNSGAFAETMFDTYRITGELISPYIEDNKVNILNMFKETQYMKEGISDPFDYSNLSLADVEVVELTLNGEISLNEINVKLYKRFDTEEIDDIDLLGSIASSNSLVLNTEALRSVFDSFANNISVFNSSQSPRNVIDLLLLMGARSLVSEGSNIRIKKFFNSTNSNTIILDREYVLKAIFGIEFQEIEDFSNVEVLEFWESRNLKNKLKKIYDKITPLLKDKISLEYIINKDITIEDEFSLDGKKYFVKKLTIEDDTIKLEGFEIGKGLEYDSR